MQSMIRTLLLAALMSPFGSAIAASTHLSPLEIVVPSRGAAFDAGDDAGTRYEVHVTNLSAAPVEIQAVIVRDTGNDAVVTIYDGDRLQAQAWRPRGDAHMLAPGERMVLFVDLDHAGRAALRNDIRYLSAGQTQPRIARGPIVPPGPRASPRIGPPLRGGDWVAVYDPMLARGHRRVLYSVDGIARIPGRFAIDWMRPAGVEWPSHANDEVLAVADGVVVEMRNDMPDYASTPSEIPLEDGTGNFVAIDLGEGDVAFYEHLKADILVKRGQHVRRGDVIGFVGASGHAMKPHLHFHIADANSALGGEGQPFSIDGMRVMGTYPSIAAFDAGTTWTPWSPTRPIPGFPPQLAVVAFPD